MEGIGTFASTIVRNQIILSTRTIMLTAAVGLFTTQRVPTLARALRTTTARLVDAPKFDLTFCAN